MRSLIEWLKSLFKKKETRRKAIDILYKNYFDGIDYADSRNDFDFIEDHKD